MTKTWSVPDYIEPDIYVVGTDNYRVAHPKKDGHIFEVTIIREPQNKHDRNALAVQYKGKTFGYVSSARAEKLAPVLDKAGVSTIKTRAKCSDGIIQGYDVHVAMIAAVPDLQYALGLPEDLSELRFTIKAAGKHLDAYRALCKPNEERSQYLAQVTTEVTPSGKYAGQPIYYFWVKGKRIGEASARYREENLDFYRALETGATKAEVELCIFSGDKPWGKATVKGYKIRSGPAPTTPQVEPPSAKGLFSRLFGR